MEAFTSSLLMIALAEMGDKTQLMALALASRYPVASVILGVCLGILTTNLLAAAGGTLIGAALPVTLVRLVSGVAFLGFAVWTLRDRCEDQECAVGDRLPCFLAVGSAFFLAELGDKTQLTALALAADSGEFVSVWVGSSLGMALAAALAITVGALAHRRLPEQAVRLASAAVFALFGVLAVADGLTGLR
jgi:putative Ca2+/H+ antiporter (TMEM165/GDT1 family)